MKRESGQALSEYVVILAIMAVTVIACTAILVGPAAAAFAGFFRRLVLYFTSS